MPKSYAPQVIADNSGQWCGNALRFATEAEAEANVRDLKRRWTGVRKTRVVESDDPVNYQYIDGKTVPVPDLNYRQRGGGYEGGMGAGGSVGQTVKLDPPEPLQCSICDGPIEVHRTWTQGHNAQPVNDGRCCDDCNSQVVVPTRIVQLYRSQKK
jgi:hypothetical protein